MERTELARLTALAACTATAALALGCSSDGATCDTQDNESHAIMLPHAALAEAWQAEHESLELRDFSAAPERFQSVEASLDYDPVTYNQGACGDCWVWAGTTVLEVALNHARAAAAVGDNVELSVQWSNSIASQQSMIDEFGDSTGFKGPCCGGTLNLLTRIYNADGDEVVPIGGENTEYEDANRSASKKECLSSVSKSAIDRRDSINVGEIATLRLGSPASAEGTITHIQDAIDSGEAVYMSMQLPNAEAWDGFRDMWVNDASTALYDPTAFCGETYDSCNGGGGHALAIIGYADDGTDDSYWLILNSWGAPENRPSATYRMQMRGIDYRCSYTSASGGSDIDALHFQSLSISPF